ncbi:hypothetical protein [Nocardia terpenica]|uniref:Uncharacterized protein n=1 Tax=Nocardia terpenica TaxID=455432 RepID=A0A164LAC7_9NOCA|nr:hypothetical protein [Nocardia terpenica]KZM72186.1 hypothetical protein AWN90_36530 [Nocardia terpenica]NQE86670.1 hypothetical protein [Nocardia terpenica]
MSTPTAKELETVIRWLETHADNDHTSVLKDYLATAKADLSQATAEEGREFAFAKAIYEAAPHLHARPWDLGLPRKWADLTDTDRRNHVRRSAPLAEALVKAGWTKPATKPRTWENLADIPANVIVVDQEGDRWENRNGKWGLGTGGNWGTYVFGPTEQFGPFREYLG